MRYSGFIRYSVACRIGKPPREIQASRVNASALRRRLSGEGRRRGHRFPARIPLCGLREVECARRLREAGKSPREIQASGVSASALRRRLSGEGRRRSRRFPARIPLCGLREVECERRLRETGKPPREIQASRVSASALRRRLSGEGRRRGRRFPARIPRRGLRR